MHNYYSINDATHEREEGVASYYIDIKSSSGLSKRHIETLPCSIFYLGGNKIKANRHYEYIPHKIGKKGKIKGYSPKSRRNFLYKLAEISKDAIPIFVTLTFPDEFYNQRFDAKSRFYILNKFTKRMKRAFPEIGGYWRKEFEKRKSGKYIGEIFQHYHLLAFYNGDIGKIRGWIALNWWEVCGKLSDDHLAAGTRTEKLRNMREGSKYIGKYMSKEMAEEIEDTGRLWGAFNIENIPFVKGILVQLTDEEAKILIRYMRKFAKLHGRDYKALTVFCDPDYWHKRLPDILYPK